MANTTLIDKANKTDEREDDFSNYLEMLQRQFNQRNYENSPSMTTVSNTSATRLMGELQSFNIYPSTYGPAMPPSVIRSGSPSTMTPNILPRGKYKIMIPLALLDNVDFTPWRAMPEVVEVKDNFLVFKEGYYLNVEDSNDVNIYVGTISPRGTRLRFEVNQPNFLECYIPEANWATFKPKKAKPVKSKIKFESVIIEPSKVEHIKEAISQRENESVIFDDWGFSQVFEKGTAISLLFYGIPGTGKTLMAQAIADHLKMELSIIGAADIQTSEPGGAERKIKGIFKKAGKESVILLDECDSLLMDRNSVGHIMASQINTLLSAIESFEGVVIFTTNRLGRLDPALERRITAKIEFVFPSKEARLQIWKRMLPKKAPLAKDVDLKKLAEFPLTGGNIKNAVLQAARRAAYQKRKDLDQSCFVYAIDKEIEALQEFAAAKTDTFRQGNMVASRDQNVVEGNYGESMVQLEEFANSKK